MDDIDYPDEYDTMGENEFDEEGLAKGKWMRASAGGVLHYSKVVTVSGRFSGEFHAAVCTGGFSPRHTMRLAVAGGDPDDKRLCSQCTVFLGLKNPGDPRLFLYNLAPGSWKLIRHAEKIGADKYPWIEGAQHNLAMNRPVTRGRGMSRSLGSMRSTAVVPNPIDPVSVETRRIRDQIDAKIGDVARLEHRLHVLESLPAEPAGVDDQCTVIWFKKQFVTGGKWYTYAAVRCDNGLWSTTGPSSPKLYTWGEMIKWIMTEKGHDDQDIEPPVVWVATEVDLISKVPSR